MYVNLPRAHNSVTIYWARCFLVGSQPANHSRKCVRHKMGRGRGKRGHGAVVGSELKIV